MTAMDCRQVRELLPWWVNATLDEDQRRQVDEHLASCQQCRAELEETRIAVAVAVQHLPSEALVAHAAGRDPGIDPELFETHLASCRDCADELALLVESREALLGDGGAASEAREPGKVLDWRPREPSRTRESEEAPKGVSDRHRVGRVSTWQRGAAAAALVAVAAGYGAFSARREAARLAERLAELEAPQVNVALVDLYPDELVLRTGTSDVPPVEVPTYAGRATLILNSRLPPSSGPLRLEVRDPEGRPVLVIDGLTTDADGLLTLSLRTDDLAGERILVLFDPRSESPKPLEAYRVRAGPGRR